MEHTARVVEESPADSLDALGDRVYYLHIKDAVYDTSHPQAKKDGWRDVEPGTGQLTLREALELLKVRGYDGYAMFEWEKRWHRDLPEPEDMFPKFISWFEDLGL